MDTSIVVNVVVFLTTCFIGLTFVKAMYPLYEALLIQREKTRLKMAGMQDGTWVEIPPEKKENPLISWLKGKKKTT